MLGVKYALDTDVAIASLNREPSVMERIDVNGVVALPMVVVGELIFGASNSKRFSENALTYTALIQQNVLLPVDVGTAREYAALKLALRRKGQPIPENDIWIAAACIFHELVLVTHDKHFRHCPGLTTEDWLAPLPDDEEGK